MAKIVIEIPDNLGEREDSPQKAQTLVATALTHYRDYLQQGLKELDGLPERCNFLVDRHFDGTRKQVHDELQFFEAIAQTGNIFFEPKS